MSRYRCFFNLSVEAKLVRFESADAPALHTPSLLVLIQVARRGHKVLGFDLQKFSSNTRYFHSAQVQPASTMDDSPWLISTSPFC